MTYPAELHFKRDRSLSPTARRVYDYLSTVLDFCEVRAVKSQVHPHEAGVDRGAFIRALTQLVASGYLVEHKRDARDVRRFTLTWSINADVSRGGAPVEKSDTSTRFA